MQFLVYLTVLMVSISTVLLEVHWLTSPPPQPKPAVQVSSAPTQSTKIESPSATLSPVYPKKVEAPPQTTADTQQPQTSPDTVSVPAAIATKPEPQKTAIETTGVPARADDTSKAAEASTESVQATMSNNCCNVQACSNAYQSFRASDCTYQPFEGVRRLCEKPPVQRTAHDQAEHPERRQWTRDGAPHDSERTIRRRVYDDPDESDVDVGDDSGQFSVFHGRGPRW